MEQGCMGESPEFLSGGVAGNCCERRHGASVYLPGYIQHRYAHFLLSVNG